MGIHFKGLIAPTDVPTGDGRIFQAGKATHRPLPIPLMAQFGSGGHAGAKPVGKIEQVYPGPGGYWAEGHFLDPTVVPEVVPAVHMLQHKVLGPSVDLDRDYTVTAVPHPTRPDKKAGLFSEYNIIGTTLVPMPAFHQVHLSVDNDDHQAKSLLASAGVDLSLFIDPEQFAEEFGFDEVVNPNAPAMPQTDANNPVPPVLGEQTHTDRPAGSPVPGYEPIDGTPKPTAGDPTIFAGAAGVSQFAPAGMGQDAATHVASLLQNLVLCHTAFYLALKQAHWNVIGPGFTSVHPLLDKWAEMAEDMADDCAERIAALGASPTDTPQAMVAGLTPLWANYPLRKADSHVHLRALDANFTYIAEEIRKGIAATAVLDPITQNILLGHGQELEHQQWFLRARLENPLGGLTPLGELI